MSQKEKPTPIIEAKNLGPQVEKELAELGITTLDQIKDMGWEKMCFEYAQAYPQRLNLNLFYAILGAVKNTDWRELDPSDKEKAKELLMALKTYG